MKNILTALILMLFVGGCLKPFNTKEQAKNEVNKKGYRVGRWVDYLDSTGVKTKDEVNYKSYILSEYEDGKPFGNYRQFDKKDAIISKGTFKSEGVLCDMNTTPSKYIGIREWFEGDAIGGKNFFNNEGELEKEVFYIKNSVTSKNDSITSILEFFPVNTNENKLLNSKAVKEISVYANDSLFYKLTFDETPWSEGLKKSDEFVKYLLDKLIPSLKDQKFNTELERKVYNCYVDLLSQPYYFKRLHYISVWKSGKSGLEEVDFKKQMKEGHQIWLATNGTSSSNVRCYYCGRVFNKTQGFVMGVQSTRVRRYSSVLFDLEVAKQMNPQVAKTLSWNYSNGRWFCSEQCVNLSGNEILE